MISAWWCVWALAAAAVACNWWLLRELREWERWQRQFRCRCGREALHVDVSCNHVDGWHHGAESCAPLHEGIHP